MVRFPPPKSHDTFCPPPLRIPKKIERTAYPKGGGGCRARGANEARRVSAGEGGGGYFFFVGAENRHIPTKRRALKP